MIHQPLERQHGEAVTHLVSSVFGASEGAQQGRLVGRLASALCAGIDQDDILGFGTVDNGAIVAAIFFTRLRLQQNIRICMLSPVAVATAHQRQGIGQALIRHGLNELKRRGVAAVVTYGDPAYYGRLGFAPLSQDVIRAPLDLSMPHGWQGQSLTDAPLATIHERPVCVAPFNDPAYW